MQLLQDYYHVKHGEDACLKFEWFQQPKNSAAVDWNCAFLRSVAKYFFLYYFRNQNGCRLVSPFLVNTVQNLASIPSSTWSPFLPHLVNCCFRGSMETQEVRKVRWPFHFLFLKLFKTNRSLAEINTTSQNVIYDTIPCVVV